MKGSRGYIFKNPKLSILMPVYNEEATIEKITEQIDAVDLKRIGVSREIIMVDDGSKDRTVEIIRRLMKRYPYIKFIQI